MDTMYMWNYRLQMYYNSYHFYKAIKLYAGKNINYKNSAEYITVILIDLIVH